MFELVSSTAVTLVIFTAALLILARDWRLRIGLLAVQYLGVFAVILLSWPTGMSVTILIAGWMAGAVLAMALISIGSPHNPPTRSAIGVKNSLAMFWKSIITPEHIFRFLCILLVILIVFSFAPGASHSLAGFQYDQILVGLLLLCLGLLQLFLNSDPLSTILGLLSFLSGFEVMYSAQEASILVAGLLALITLGIALVGAYLLLAPQMEAEV